MLQIFSKKFCTFSIEGGFLTSVTAFPISCNFLWGVNRPKKDPEYYEAQKEKYKELIAGNELLTIPSVFEAVSHRTISLLACENKNDNSVSRKIMEEGLNCLSITPKILPRRSNAMRDISLATVDEANALAVTIITTKSVRTQTEYLGP